MQARIWPATVLVLAGMWACGGSTFVVGNDGGPGSGSGSGAGMGSGSGSGSSGSSSGSGTSGSGSSGQGGSSSSGSGGGGSNGSSGGSGGGDGCPSKPPSNGSGCSPVGLDCEYGGNPNPQCNILFSCTAAGWAAPTGAPSCPGGMCPLTYDAVPQNMSCSPAGLDCSYLRGQCNCATTLPVATMGPVWQCSIPAMGCPNPRPRIGAACTQDGLSCNYGACAGGVELDCMDGYWRQALVACPG